MNKDVLHINTGVLKMKEIMLLAAIRMQLEIITLSEVSQKDKHHDIIYLWDLKYSTNEPI